MNKKSAGRCRRILAAALPLAALFYLAMPAQAQDSGPPVVDRTPKGQVLSNGGADVTSASPSNSSAVAKTQAPLAQSSNPLFSPSPFQNLAKRMIDLGIHPNIGYQGQWAANPIGGELKGQAYAGKLVWGAAFDMNKLADIHGATINTLFTWDSGTNLSGHTINSDLSVNNLFVGSQTWQLAVLTWEQKLFDDKLDLNFGRTDFAFLTSPLYCDFQSHGNCGREYGIAKNTTTAIYPTAVWGGRAALDITPNWFTKVGIYQPNPDLTAQKSHGFNWSIRTQGVSGGFEIPVEFGYKDRNPGALVDNRIAVGYIKSQTNFTASFANAAHPNFAGRSMVYLMAQKMVWQPKAGSSRGLHLFTEDLLDASGNKESAKFQVSLGAVFQGPFESRPADRVDLLLNDYKFNQAFLNAQYATRVKAGGKAFPFHNQGTVELNYAYTVNSWFQVMPNLQYVWHPDGLGYNPYPKSNIKDAVVIGIQANIDLLGALGVPSYPWAAILDN